MQHAELKARLKGLDKDTAKAVACACIGHSKVIGTCFGYVVCARCDAQIGDTLAGVFDTTRSVIVGHDCETCRVNALMLEWTDTFMVDESKVFPNTRS